MLLNGILWAAKIEVPTGGVTCNPAEELLK
jgi:hypothetical protein